MAKWRIGALPRYTSPEVPINMGRLIGELQAAMPPDGILVADGGFAAHWTGLLYDTQRSGRTYIADRGLASIGYGIPGALGAQLGAPDVPVVAITGDAGLNMTMGDIETLRRTGANAIVVVVNNAASGYVKALQHAMYGEGNYQSSELVEMDYAAIARAMGCRGIRVEDPGELAGAFRSALGDRSLPTIVDVVVTRSGRDASGCRQSYAGGETRRPPRLKRTEKYERAYDHPRRPERNQALRHAHDRQRHRDFQRAPVERRLHAARDQEHLPQYRTDDRLCRYRHVRAREKSAKSYSRADWFDLIVAQPGPRVCVLQDLDDPPCGAFWGEIQTNIHKALDCVGVVTNGGVRDLREVEAAGFQYYAGSVMVSHAYVHLVECGQPVDIGGVKVLSGDIVHADLHGVQIVPRELVHELPAACEKIIAKERTMISYCQSPEFTLEGLKKRL